MSMRDRLNAERERIRRIDAVLEAQRKLPASRLNPVDINMERLRANVFHLVAPKFTRPADD